MTDMYCTISAPAGWIWIPPSTPVVTEDPDVEDRLPTPRWKAETLRWEGIHAAVFDAIRLAQQGGLTLSDVEVVVPVNLNDREIEIARTWLMSSPVSIDWLHHWNGHFLSEGRHRLWATRTSQEFMATPIRTALSYNMTNYPLVGGDVRQDIRESLELEALHLLANHADPVVSANPHLVQTVNLARIEFDRIDREHPL